jgi:RNA polymerase sigma-70 factor, ECF subfamily
LESFDAARVQRLQQGDPESWQDAVSVLTPPLYNYLRYNLPTHEDTEDVLSECLLATVRAIKGFDGKSKFSTWVFGIAQHKVADFYRRNKQTEELSEQIESTDSASTSTDLSEALTRMPEHLRQAVLLRYREGYSVEEVAQIMGRSYKATESLLSRGRSLLRRMIEP